MGSVWTTANALIGLQARHGTVPRFIIKTVYSPPIIDSWRQLPLKGTRYNDSGVGVKPTASIDGLGRKKQNEVYLYGVVSRSR